MSSTTWVPSEPKPDAATNSKLGLDGVATVGDFLRKSIEEVFAAIEAGEPQRLHLPKRDLVVILRHPGLMADDLFDVYRDLWEMQKAEKGQNATLPAAQQQVESTIAFTDFVSGILKRIFVEPKFGQLPGQLTMRRILPDLAFIFRWLRGEVEARPDGSARDLARFPERSGEAEETSLDRSAESVPH